MAAIMLLAALIKLLCSSGPMEVATRLHEVANFIEERIMAVAE